MLGEGKVVGGEASVKCVIKWVKCCCGISVCWQAFRCMPNPPQSLLSLACSTCSAEGGGRQEEKRMTGTQAAFILCTKTLSFSSRLSNISLPLLPSFSSQLWLSSQIPTEWDKERKRERQRQGGERWWDASVLSHGHWEHRETTWLVCLCFSVTCVRERVRVFVCFRVKCTIVQRSGDCVYLSLFSNAGGKERERKH